MNGDCDILRFQYNYMTHFSAMTYMLCTLQYHTMGQKEKGVIYSLQSIYNIRFYNRD